MAVDNLGSTEHYYSTCNVDALLGMFLDLQLLLCVLAEQVTDFFVVYLLGTSKHWSTKQK